MEISTFPMFYLLPLMTSILVFMGLCISLHPHLKWRKSMRSLTIHLNKCILPLQEYGNISYKLSSLHRRSQDSQERQPALGAPQYAHRGSSQNQSQLLSLRPQPRCDCFQRAQAAYAIEAIFHLTDPEELKKAEEEEDSASTPSLDVTFLLAPAKYEETPGKRRRQAPAS